MIERFLQKTEFASYEDFTQGFALKTPVSFNFAYDVMDELAGAKGNERALVWCDEKGAEANFTYADLKRLSDKNASAFKGGRYREGRFRSCSSSSGGLNSGRLSWPSIARRHRHPATHLITTKAIALPLRRRRHQDDRLRGRGRVHGPRG
jgi:acetyl-CoA synthetase